MSCCFLCEVEGLLPVATREIDGLMYKKLVPVQCNISSLNQAIEITLSNPYGAEVYFLSIYRSGYVALYFLVIHPYLTSNSSVRYIGSPIPGMKVYVNDKKIVIDVRTVNSLSATVTPTALNNCISGIKVVSSIDTSEMTEIEPKSMN